MLDPAQLQQLIFINTLGLSVLVQTLRTASYMYLTTNDRGRIISPTGRTRAQSAECFAFIQGTGLELFLQRHCIDMNAETLRDGFYLAIGQRGLIE